ncbi:PREDICTED: dynein assembly factor 3, axonemal [Gekko japonicus]|uniref:Dynein axonemal assembly factor 3 n=1 Tax=Gekko japonicus TaxID=146911 RepID=A0ABM1KRB5_GEKJA|nr:PREDICTED: dynein assembly factor 3, axonemal [Gekko japonicus]
MTAAGSGNGFGTTAWWGFSPALDLQATYLDTPTEHLHVSQDGIPELNILLVGSIDGRHILKTMCQAHRWPRRKINFYVLENNLEVLGRQLLFLSLALEPLEKMGLQEKSETFLELMGNTLLRSQTAAYLQEKAGLFVRYVTDPCIQQADLPALDLSALKFKERDQLEAIFRFWKNPDPWAFQMEQLWDLRLRQYLGARYDARRGVCDWDLTMKLHEHGAKVINSREFFRWRNTGVAFEMREASYDVPNKTLASGRLLRHKGEPMPARGYWGDIATGPFITFGLETEETSLLKTVNGLPSKGAQEISLYNVTALFYELSHRSRYDPPTASDKEGEEGSLQGEEDQATLDAANSPPDTEDIRVHFLPLNCLPRLHQKGKYQKLFNLLFFSCSMVHLLKPELCLVSAPKATLVIELANFLPDLRKEQVSEFCSRVTNLARETGFVPVEAPGQEAFSLFQRQDPPEVAEPGL